jgi:serine O-acetyltransferase
MGSLIEKVGKEIEEDYLEGVGKDYDHKTLQALIDRTRDLMTLDFVCEGHDGGCVHKLVEDIYSSAESLLGPGDAERYVSSLPKMRRLLRGSVEAIYDGDPACGSFSEVAHCYPGFYAITNYRIGHELYRMGHKDLGRYVTEQAHCKTGIDINPGAEIGESFFIDHGTGIVIGETAIVKDHVKLYQGVTLGAMSLSKGQGLKGKKRHPTIESGVTIYSNATILGDVTIGEGSTIGANVYLTRSVGPGRIVYLGDAGIAEKPKGKEI